MAALLGDALRQAFMPKHEYETLRDEDKAWHRLQRPVLLSILTLITLAIVISTVISMKIVFPSNNGRRPFCGDLRIQPLSINVSLGVDSDRHAGAFYLTDQETVPKGGGVRCLFILNVVFAILFGLLALFLGSTLLTLGSSCSAPLFWCYEIVSLGLVILYVGAAFSLRRKAALILDDSDFAGQNLGVEMLEANPVEFTPDLERRVNDGFKAWMGSSFLSSDEEDDPDDYQEVPHPSRTNSSRQRV
ncbi:hypothetical protein RJ639_015266 [Escallonia herrerae]|uniref:Uncharacterized protein n=1 Tax=Escallonia herrerae TaxID=1293975 RepID=A0AA89ALS8_9ASTE|nr:hypothetical protein RJ639_015266 [Escallonia herrerae]